MEIRYSALVNQAMRLVVREALRVASLSGGCNFVISFLTKYPKVSLEEQLRAKYEERMTVVLNNQYSQLEVGVSSFAVTLIFSGIPSRMTIPFGAILSFCDRNAQFSLDFRIEEGEDDSLLDGMKGIGFYSDLEKNLESKEEKSGPDAAMVQSKHGKILSMSEYLKQKKGEPDC